MTAGLFRTMRGRALRHSPEALLRVACAIAAVAMLVVAQRMFVDSARFLHCCDVTAYWEAAARYRAFGFFDFYSETRLRTYAFPGLLSLILALADLLHANPRALLSGFQVVTYLLSCWVLANAATEQKTWRSVILIGLVGNPFAVPYLVTGLADATALVLFQFWLGLMLLHWRAMARSNGSWLLRYSWIIAAALIAGLTMEVRPAYVWLPAVTLVCATWSPAVPWKREWGQRLRRLTICGLMAALPMIPQSLINLRHFDRWTPLPTVDLQQYQVTLGKANLKYATRLYPGATASLFYPNPFYERTEDPSSPDDPLDWYLAEPLPALATIATKFVNAFDFDFVEPYIHDPKPRFQLGWRLLSLLLMFIGCCGVAAKALGVLGPQVALGPRFFPALLLLGWGAVTMVTVTELRFSLPMLTLFVLTSTAVAVKIATFETRRIWRAIAAGALALAAIFSIANATRTMMQL